MAKIKQVDVVEVAEVAEVTEAPIKAVQESVDEVPTAKEEKVAKESVKVTNTVKFVEVQLTDDVDSTVAKVRYTGRKGKTLSVPTDVAAILVNAKSAYRI